MLIKNIRFINIRFSCNIIQTQIQIQLTVEYKVKINIPKFPIPIHT